MRWITVALVTLVALNVLSYCWLVLLKPPVQSSPSAKLPTGVASIELVDLSGAGNQLASAPVLEPGAVDDRGLCWYIGLERDPAQGGPDRDQELAVLGYVLERMRAIALVAQPVQIDTLEPAQHWVQVASSELAPAQLLTQLLADGFDVYLADTELLPEGVVAGPFASEAEARQQADELSVAGWQVRHEETAPTRRRHWLRLSGQAGVDPVPALWWEQALAEWPTLVKRRYYCAGVAQSQYLE